MVSANDIVSFPGVDDRFVVTTGGRFRSDGEDHYGSYPSNAIFPLVFRNIPQVLRLTKPQSLHGCVSGVYAPSTLC